MKKQLSLLGIIVILICLVVGAGPKASATAWEPSLAAQSASSSFATLEDAAAYLRAQLVARNTFITVSLRGDGVEVDNTQLLEMALQHTGRPKEGDYLRANMLNCSYSVTHGTDQDGQYVTFVYAIEWLADARQEAEVDEAVETLLNTLNLWNASDYDKIKGVYDWITANITYDYDWDDEDPSNLHKHSTHAAIINRVAVCQGIASLYYRLCLELGVDCRYISGTAGQTELEPHGWNIVRLEGKYYHMDPTWDLGMTNVYRYFLVSGKDFPHHYRSARYDTAQFHTQYPMAETPYVQNVTASGTISNRIRWVLDGDTGTLTVTGTGAIPSYRFSDAPWKAYRDSVLSIVIGEGITEVGERAFYWCKNCTSVSLPDSLIAIREYGFNNLRSLQEVTLPPNLRIIEFCGFSECVALRSITLPNSVTTVGSNAFSNCSALTTATLSSGMTTVPDSMFFADKNLRTVILPEGITTICDTAFMNCGFREFTIPASVRKIEIGSFAGCTSMKKFIVEEGNTAYKATDGVLFTADGTHLVCYPAYKTGSYVIPEGTLYIDYDAFRENVYLSGITFPSTLRKIDDYAFSWCYRLASITFPENITFIGDSAFRSCTGLKSVTFQSDTVTLDGYVFAGCKGLRTITLPAKLTSIPNGLLSDCVSLSSITIPSTVTRIGSTAFYNCDGLTSVTIPGHVKSIGQQAFDYCGGLAVITLEEGVQTLDWIAIRNAPNLTKVVIPSSVTTIGRENFKGCPRAVLYVKCGTRGYSYAVSNGLSYSATHTYSPSAVTKPTCTAYGYTTYSCPCGSSYTDNYVESLGHNYGAWYTATEATCDNNGWQRRDCTRCGEFETKLIVATGHSYNSVVTKPTCTKEGYTTHSCHCGDSYTDSRLNPLGHQWGAGVIMVAPTEEAEGQRRFTCQRCGEIKTETIPKLDHIHSYTSTVTKPTCTAQGYTMHICACGDSYKDAYTNALGHQWDSGKVTKQPTCKEAGVKTYTCTVCSSTKTETIAKLTTHTYNAGAVTKQPTCKETGVKTYTCSVCGVTKTETVAKLTTHTYGNWTKVNDTTHKHICTVCGKEESTSHSWDGGKVTKQPTCKEEGIKTYTCSFCGGTKTETIAKLTTHTYNAGVVTKQPTCKETGVKTYTCSVCGVTKTETVAKLTTHTYGNWTKVNDSTHKHTCTVCGKEETGSHSWNSGVITKQPTKDAEGVKTYTCSVCNGTKTEAVPKIPTYAVVFKNWDGTVLSTKQYAIGEKVTVPANPTRPDDADYTYTFKGWDKAVVNCNGAVTYTATYTAKSRVPSAITSSAHTVSGNTISKIGVGETVEKLLGSLNEGSFVKVYSGNKEVAKDALIGTGMEVKIMDGNTVKATYTAVVTGDTNGDGKISVTDMLAAKAHILKKSTLTGVTAQAADTSGDNAISITDFLQLKAHILGKSTVSARSASPASARRQETPAPKAPERVETNETVAVVPTKIVLALPIKKMVVML